MIWIPIIYLGIGLLVSLGAGIYAMTLKRAFNFEAALTVFLVYIPLLWPIHLYRIARDIFYRKFKR